MAPTVFTKISLYLRMIKFSHSVFALPFAFTGALLAAQGIPSVDKLAWITVAMVAARSGAMGLNRIIDRNIDRLNPRTQRREIPSGEVGVGAAALFSLLSLALFVFAAARLNTLCLVLSPVAIGFFVLYSFTKRFTWLCHFILGLAIALGPLGAWIAVRGSIDPRILTLSAALVFWLAGFDVLYALQDLDFDRSSGLFSIPARFGIDRSLLLARVCHIVTLCLLLATGYLFGGGLWYWLGMLLVAGLFLYEHSLVTANDLSRLDMAFFNMNGYISVSVFIFTLIDVLVKSV
jgi:4-hydroxybenzoate polyprenyltransferase